MDAPLRPCLHNQHGFVLVYLTLAMVLLMGMAALALDTGHLYVIKAQLQNAADAGALAGGASLDGSASSTQAAARVAAQTYAGKNSAAGKPVQLELNYGNSATGDIVVGCWNAKATPPPVDIDRSCKKPDALKINARKSVDAGSGPAPVKTIFARVAGINQMNVGAVAIAYRPSKQHDTTTLVK
jgi:Flp pilus assembly protein TadG